MYFALYIPLYRDNLSLNHVLFPYRSYINLRGLFHVTVRFLIILFFLASFYYVINFLKHIFGSHNYSVLFSEMTAVLVQQYRDGTYNLTCMLHVIASITITPVSISIKPTAISLASGTRQHRLDNDDVDDDNIGTPLLQKRIANPLD